MGRGPRVCGLLLAALAAAVAMPLPRSANATSAAAPPPPPSVPEPPLLRFISQITGPTAAVPTARADVWGCDLGIVVDNPAAPGTVALIFGDTFGLGSEPGAGPKTDWRSNTLAVSTPLPAPPAPGPGPGAPAPAARAGPGPWSGFGAAAWAANASGAARALLQGRHDTSLRTEVSLIPSTAWSNGTHLLAWVASVRGFYGDRWVCNNASVASAPGDPLRAAWTLHSDTVRWPADSNFQQFAAVHVAAADAARAGADPACGALLEPGRLYLLATRCGRTGPAYLAKVARAPGAALRGAAYRYYAGPDPPTGVPRWSPDAAAAVAVLAGGVGELSVSWSGALARFVASYTAPRSRVVARTSRCLWRGWGPARLLAGPGGASGAGELVYGGFSHPKLHRDGALHFVVSRAHAYNTWLAGLNATALLPAAPGPGA